MLPKLAGSLLLARIRVAAFAHHCSGSVLRWDTEAKSAPDQLALSCKYVQIELRTESSSDAVEAYVLNQRTTLTSH